MSGAVLSLLAIAAGCCGAGVTVALWTAIDAFFARPRRPAQTGMG